MKKLLFALIALCVVTSFAFAQVAASTATTSDQAVAIKGVIIDNMCAESHKDGLAEFVKTHPKSCVFMPDCAASEFSIYVDGKLTKFDKESNPKIEEFLKKEGSSLEVNVTVKKVVDEMGLDLVLDSRGIIQQPPVLKGEVKFGLVSIENQK